MLRSCSVKKRTFLRQFIPEQEIKLCLLWYCLGSRLFCIFSVILCEYSLCSSLTSSQIHIYHLMILVAESFGLKHKKPIFLVWTRSKSKMFICKKDMVRRSVRDVLQKLAVFEACTDIWKYSHLTFEFWEKDRNAMAGQVQFHSSQIHEGHLKEKRKHFGE